jgi:hypothetical protein
MDGKSTMSIPRIMFRAIVSRGLPEAATIDDVRRWLSYSPSFSRYRQHVQDNMAETMYWRFYVTPPIGADGLAARFGVTRQRVYQMERAALRRLAHPQVLRKIMSEMEGANR